MFFYLMFSIDAFLFNWGNRLISNVRHVLLRKTDIKTSIFSKRKFEKKCTSFEEQKGTRHIRGNIYFGIIFFSCLSSKTVFQISFNLCSGDKTLLSEFLMTHGFVDERTMITVTLTSSCLWKTYVPFCLQKKKNLKKHF